MHLGHAADGGDDDFISCCCRHALLAAGARPWPRRWRSRPAMGGGGAWLRGGTGWSGTFWFWDGDLRSHSSSLSLLRVVRVLVAADSDLTTGTRAGSPPTRI